MPITPNSSRPHTPQTPGTQITPAGAMNNSGNSGNSQIYQGFRSILFHSNFDLYSKGSFTPQPTQIHQGSVAPPQGPIPQQQPTPQPSSMPGQHVPQPQVMMTYFMPPQQSYPGAPHAQQTRFARKGQCMRAMNIQNTIIN